MHSTKILVQVNSSFDLYICTALIKDKRNKHHADLLIPYHLIKNLPENVYNSYDIVKGYDPKIRNLFSKSAIINTLRISKWLRSRCKHYHAVIFGAFRNDMTSLLARHFFDSARLIAIKQGIEISKTRYRRHYSFRELHDDLYYWIFGYSSFGRERLIQHASPPSKSDYFYMRPFWKKDPFNLDEDVFTIGIPSISSGDSELYLLPDFNLMRNKKSGPNSRDGVFIIGERTPMSPSWGEEQDSLLRDIFAAILNEVKGERIYVRARKNLTNVKFYSQLNPIFLDPEQHYDDQLLKLNPRLVISVKSTACKVAAYYGYTAIVLFTCLNFEATEREYLDYLFGDGAPLKCPSSVEELSDILAGKLIPPVIDRKFSENSRDNFFKQVVLENN